MNTQQKLEEAEAILREIYKTNEGPRLIQELLEEFKNPRGRDYHSKPMSHSLG